MCPRLTPWREEARRTMLSSAINKAAEDERTDAHALRALLDEVEAARMTVREIEHFKKRLQAILAAAQNPVDIDATEQSSG